MSINKKLLIAASLVVVIIVIALNATISPSSNNQSQVAQEEPPATHKDQALNDNEAESSTIAQQWQWEKVTKTTNEKKHQTVQLPFTPQSVHDALQAVKIDDNGDVILDHDALLSLDETLERIYNKLDGDSLKQLRDLIEQALPGSAGEQVAKLVEDYSAFLKAKDQFSQTHEGSPPAYDQQSVASISSDEALYGELKALRLAYLGDEAATTLFAVSDATSQFMFDSMKLEFDEALTPDEKSQLRIEYQQRLDATIGTPDQ